MTIICWMRFFIMLAKMMGGEIVVTSQPGQGSTFTFTLLFAKSANTVRDQALPEQSATVSLPGTRLILCEDIDINRQIILEFLKDTGIMTSEAKDGLEGVKLFQDLPVGHYDLVLMYIQMPRMDGYEATRQIRSLEREDAPTIPIVALTANAYQEDIDKALAAGMNRHLAKPLEICALIHTLQDLLAPRIQTTEDSASDSPMP